MSDDKPLVSVVIPTHNREDCIKRAIDSVLNQTYENIELIVVDDASLDQTAQIVLDIKDERLKFFQHQVNKGGSAARNTGIKSSRGEFVAFLDDDDVWLSRKLEKQMALYSEAGGEVGVVSCASAKFRNGLLVQERWPERQGDVYQYLIDTWHSYSTPTAVIRRQYLEAVEGFDEDLPSHQEIDLFIRLAKLCQFKFVDEILVHIHLYDERIGANIKGGIEGKVKVLNKIAQDMSRNALFSHRVELGRYYTYIQEFGSARKEFFESDQDQTMALVATYAFFLVTIRKENVLQNCEFKR